MPISQERVAAVHVPPYTYAMDDESLGKKIIIKISEGVFKNCSFTLYDLKVVEDGNDAMLQFSYDIVEGAEKIPDQDTSYEFESVVSAIVNEILLRSIKDGHWGEEYSDTLTA